MSILTETYIVNVHLAERTYDKKPFILPHEWHKKVITIKVVCYGLEFFATTQHELGSASLL